MNRFWRVFLILSTVTITILGIRGLIDFSKSPYTGIFHHNLIIQKIDQNGPNRGIGLLPGDKIVSVNGISPRNINHFRYLIFSNTERRVMIYEIARGDSVFQVPVKSVVQPRNRLTLKFAFFIVALSFIVVGAVVVIKRFDIMGLLFSIICITFAFLFTEKPISHISFLHVSGELIHDFLFIFLPAFFLHFFLIFPGWEIGRESLRGRIIRFLYIPPALFYVSSFIMALLRFSNFRSIAALKPVESLIAVYWLAYMLASIAFFVRTYKVSDKVQRVKFRIVMIGVALGVLPISSIMLIKQFAPSIEIPHENFSVVFLSFISISFAYAILKHGTFDVGIALRKALVYTILSILTVSVFFLLVNLFGSQLQKFLGINLTYATAVVLVLLALIFTPARRGVQKLVDRAFAKREKKYFDQVIDFSRKIQFCFSIEEIAELVSYEIVSLIDVNSVFIFVLRDQESFELKKCYPPESHIPFTEFPLRSDLGKLLLDMRATMLLEYFDRLWLKSNLGRLSRELLSMAGASAIVPLVEQNELLGFIIVGKKRNGKLFSPSDSEVLELIGERTAIALKNIDLYKDSIVKEKLEKEIHLASEIQMRLIPDKAPELKRSEIAARIKTSREVGGDFFDFIEFDGSEIGLAMADVSGKGIPAGLLMTTLKAFLRSEASAEKSTSEVVSALNSFLYDMSDMEKFATFFYARYNDMDGIIEYSNAGSFPPFIIRKDGRLDRLSRGGMILGIDKRAEFDEGITKLKEGDILVMYTDGIIDQENEIGENFGEKRMYDIIRNNLNLSVDELIDKLFATVIAFGHDILKDDITLILLRRIDTE